MATVLASLPSQALAQSYDALRGSRRALGPDGIIGEPGDALNVFEFEPAAKKAVLAQDAPAHWLPGKRSRREVGVTVARAAGKRGHQMILSTVDNASIADVNKAHGSPAWFQLYPTDDWAVTQTLVKRAEAAGCPAIVLTVDRQGGRNTEDLFRMRRQDQRDCSSCHTPGFANEVSRKSNFSDIDVSKVTNLYGTGMTWEFVDRLRGIVKGKLLLKGIVTGADAKEALRHGVDGILVSNHGGRAEESGQATIDVLAEVVDAVNGRIPVLVDGGVRRGTDVLKALAVGATAVGIGRPYVWGLASFGEPGVDRVLQILDDEFITIMRQAGAVTIDQITRDTVTRV